MKRTLLFALTIALAACGDDDAPSDDSPNGEKDAATMAKEDATVREAARDSATELLDASMEPGPVEMPDASALADASMVDAASFDAGTDSGADAGNDAGTACVAEGEDCQQGSCCDGTACVTSSEKPYPACLATCTEASDCESGCCTALSGSAKVCADESYCEEEDNPLAPLTGVNCFNNLKVFDANGEYMGDATSRYGATNGVCYNLSPYGKYGDADNNMWSFGSDAYSYTPAFSARLGCSTAFPVLAYVSKATGTADKRIIDPDNLCKVLENSNL